MRKSVLWVLAVLITLGAAVYQRLTGPSYPVKGRAVLDGTTIAFRLERSAVNTHGHEVKVLAPDRDVIGSLEWKRYPSDDLWTSRELERRGDELVGTLPKLPPAGKMEYRVLLQKGTTVISLTGPGSVVLRYRGDVPVGLLLPHILIMFLAMLFSNRAGLAALDGREKTRTLVLITLGLMFLGGFVFGPLVQKFSFGAFWSGFPIGHDLTDSKTLIAFAAWIVAGVAGRKGRKARGWVLGAAIVTLAIFLIPHSLFGSELKPRNLPH
jgi:hypothetical protein